MKKLFLLIPAILLIQYIAKGQSGPQVYYLAIGSGHYDFNFLQDNNDVFLNYEQLPEALSSSLIMAEILKKHSGAKGMTLQSSQNKMLAKEDIIAGLDEVAKMIAADNKPDPMLVLYYCGHGFVDSLLGSQFLLSGNYPKIQGKDSFEDRLEGNMYILELINLLTLKQPSVSFKEVARAIGRTPDLPVIMNLVMAPLTNGTKPVKFLLLLDCCRNPLTNDGLNAAILQKRFGAEKGKAVNNEFLKTRNMVKTLYEGVFPKINPVVFSGENMLASTVIPYPANHLPATKGLSVNTHIGPICRRTITVLDQVKKEGKTSLNLDTFLQLLTKPVKDSKTTPVTESVINDTYAYPIFHF